MTALRIRWLWRALLASTFVVPVVAQAQPADRPLRLVVNVGLQNLDPIASPTFVTRNFSYMVFDTLVAMDSKGQFRPQMLEGWRISEDGLTYTFTLRPGLEWHDGTPVTAEDCVASLRRWGARDSTGRRLMAAVKELRVESGNSFVLQLARPFGSVIDALGKPSLHVPFMMPARLAATPPTQQVPETIGSGPFRFLRDQWVPGERAVFVRNDRYRPREEPADGLAGGKVAKVERAEIVTIPDPAMRAAALQRGEVDYLEYAPLDFLPAMQKNRDLVVAKPPGIAQIMGGVAVNHLQPPFNDLRIRQALQMAMDQAETTAVHGLPEGMAMASCFSMTLCGTRYSSEAGSEALRGASIEKAQGLLRASGYRGERVVLLHPADSPLIGPAALLVADRLKRTGFNVDVQTTDWATIAQRWLRKDPVEQGGWSLVPTLYTGFDLADPLSNVGIGYNCTETAPWLYCDPQLTPLVQAFEAEADSDKRRQLADAMNARALGNVNFVLTGQYASPAVWRADLQGVIDFGFPVLWNIQRRAR